MRAVFLRALEAEDKAAALREMVHATESARPQRFDVETRLFFSIPGTPFAYWAPPTVVKAFSSLPRYRSNGRTAVHGASTCDDFRYVRAWYEVSAEDRGLGSEASWVGFARGGRFSRFYADVPSVVCWNSSRMSFQGFVGRPGRWNPKPEAADHYLQPGLTWPLRGSKFSCSMLPSGCAFSVGGKVALASFEELPFLAAVLNSAVFNAAISLHAGKVGGFQYEAGVINQSPIPLPDRDAFDELHALACRSWSTRRSLDTCVETSHAFVLPALLQVSGESLAERASVWSKHNAAVTDELEMLWAQIDNRCFELYGIDHADRHTISDGLGEASWAPGVVGQHAPEAEDDEVAAEAGLDTAALVIELMSWAVGVAFGRFDLRLATGAHELPPEPEPFEALPICSPGMLTEDGGLPARRPPHPYPISWSRDGIAVDDPGHSSDLAKRLRDVFDVVFGEAADDCWRECAQLLGGDLREWLARSFFEAHLKSYSRNRRKAPIYWQFATPTASYSLWIYAHGVSADTLYRVLNDVLTPKLRHEERNLTNLVQEAGRTPTASQRRGIESKRGFVEELHAFCDEVARVAPLWRPELDDGVLVSCAPLWRLVPHHRSWQGETKSCWAKIVNGEYDWSHMAMHLWPERVVPKCEIDRSLAIAHGLEREFWAEDAGGKWTSRQVDTATVERLVQERSSAAVKAALADLLAAG